MESFLVASGGPREHDATAKAQDLVYDAWEETSPRARIALARRALGISPLCADPYMRARAGLANALQRLDDEDAAIGHYRAMLTLNPNDNQGISYVLAACLLRRGEDIALTGLLTAYSDDAGTCWLYTRALLALREDGADDGQAVELAKAAWAENEHVLAILAGTRPPVFAHDAYVTVSGPDEAGFYMAEFGLAWHHTPGAVEWPTRLAAAPARGKPAVQ